MVYVQIVRGKLKQNGYPKILQPNAAATAPKNSYPTYKFVQEDKVFCIKLSLTLQ
jgi:hypothetical protein